MSTTALQLLEKEGFMIDTSSSLWRTAYIAAIFERDSAKIAPRIADARAAITERLKCTVEIRDPEREAIESARQRLATLQAG
jgi:hypothetical protein